jgi:hypothetical protein
VHLLLLSLYAAIASTVLAAIDPRAETNRQRVMHGLKMFAYFVGIGIVLSWVLFPIPW